jgi:hypothetical protein
LLVGTAVNVLFLEEPQVPAAKTLSPPKPIINAKTIKEIAIKFLADILFI